MITLVRIIIVDIGTCAFEFPHTFSDFVFIQYTKVLERSEHFRGLYPISKSSHFSFNFTTDTTRGCEIEHLSSYC